MGAAVMAFRLLNDVDRDRFGRAGEQVEEIGFDGVGFVKRHSRLLEASGSSPSSLEVSFQIAD